MSELGATPYKKGQKYSGRIPEIRYLPLTAIERQEMDFRPEVWTVSDEVAAAMDYSSPVEVIAFRFSRANEDQNPFVKLKDGHHRYASALQTNKGYLPVEVNAINAKGEKLNALIALSNAIEQSLEQPAPGCTPIAIPDQPVRRSSGAGKAR